MARKQLTADAEEQGWVIGPECEQDPEDETRCVFHDRFHGAV